MTTKDALKAIGADALWADEAQRKLCQIVERLKDERDNYDGACRPSATTTALLDDINTLVLSRPLVRPSGNHDNR